MEKERALEYWINRYNSAKGYNDIHWDAEERHEHRDYIRAMEWAIKAIEGYTDVQPVAHAYWIELPKALNPNENPCKCSNCGHILSFMNGYPKSKYCDDCGARMDGDTA